MENYKECIQWLVEKGWNCKKTGSQTENKAV